MSAAPKKNTDENPASSPDLPSEREQKLSKEFEDPALELLIPGLGEEAKAEDGIPILHEAADAVQELIHEASGAEPEAAASTSAEGAIDLSQGFDEKIGRAHV